MIKSSNGHLSWIFVAKNLFAVYPRVNKSEQLLLSYLTLLQVGFTKLAKSLSQLVSSYLTVSPLPQTRLFTFCCTFHRITSSSCYEALCSTESGLSSLFQKLKAARPFVLLRIFKKLNHFLRLYSFINLNIVSSLEIFSSIFINSCW